MTMSQRLSCSMSKAFCSDFSFLAWAGAAPLALEVEKNSGSIRSKSRSVVMRSMSTEPTMPRQPTRPTKVVIIFPFVHQTPSTSGPGSFAGFGGARRDGALALDGFRGRDGFDDSVA